MSNTQGLQDPELIDRLRRAGLMPGETPIAGGGGTIGPITVSPASPGANPPAKPPPGVALSQPTSELDVNDPRVQALAQRIGTTPERIVQGRSPEQREQAVKQMQAQPPASKAEREGATFAGGDEAPPAQQGHTIPAHFITTVPEPLKQHYEHAAEGMTQAPLGIGTEEQKRDQYLGGLGAAQAQGEAGLAQHQEHERSRMLRSIEQDQDHNRQLAEEISHKKVDPRGYWHSLSDGGKALSVLGLMMGGFASGFRGVPNNAMQMYMKFSEDSIRAQEQEIETGKVKLDTARGLLADKLRIYGDMPSAHAATMAAYHKIGAAYLESEARRLGSPIVMERAKLASSENEMAAAQQLRSITQRVPEQTVGGPAPPSKRTAEEAKWLSEQLTKAGIPDAESAIDSARKSLLQGTEGEGIIGHYTPDLLVGDRGRENRQLLRNVASHYKQTMEAMGRMANTSVDEAEADLFRSHTPEEIARGLSVAEQAMRDRKATISGGASDEARQLYEYQRKGQQPGTAGPGHGYTVTPEGGSRGTPPQREEPRGAPPAGGGGKGSKLGKPPAAPKLPTPRYSMETSRRGE